MKWSIDQDDEKGTFVMNKNILIAVDDSIHSNSAIRYAGNMAAKLENAYLTLFHVQPMISQFLLDEAEKDLKSRAELEKVIAKNTEAGRELLENAKELLIRKGIDDHFINIDTRPRKLGVAKDVLGFSHRGDYDAILMGRRGLSGYQAAFMGSVSANVIENSKSTPVWLIDGKVDSSKILFAVDGSENSLRAVDHLALMIGNHPDANVLFFHVQPKARDFCPVDFEDTDSDRIEEIILQGNKNCIDQFFAHALKRLKGAGFDDNQIEVKVSNTFFNPGKAIISEAKEGDFGTVIVGRRGFNRAFYTGSVSRYVTNRISDRALWIVP